MVAYILILFAVFVTCTAHKKIHPCHDVTDHSCIAHHLHTHSTCTKHVIGSIPSELRVPFFNYGTPYFRATNKATNLLVRNLDLCHFSDFVIDHSTHKVALVIDCPQIEYDEDLHISVDGSHKKHALKYHVRAKHPLIRITVEFPHKKNLDLCMATFSTKVIGTPSLHVSPHDHTFLNMIVKNPTLFNAYELENFHERGVPMALTVVQSLLCNYNCPIEGLDKLPGASQCTQH